MGAGAEGQASEEAGGHHVPEVHPAAGGVGVHRGVSGVDRGGLRCAHLPQEILHDRPLRRETHCVAEAHPQQDRRGRTAQVAQRGGDHRLEPALPVGVRHKDGDHGAIRPESRAAAGEEHHAADHSGCGQVHHPQRQAVHRTAEIPERCAEHRKAIDDCYGGRSA